APRSEPQSSEAMIQREWEQPGHEISDRRGGVTQGPPAGHWRRTERRRYRRPARVRPLLRSHARYPAAVTSYARQNGGHHVGTPGLDTTPPWTRSKTPCAASAVTTT